MARYIDADKLIADGWHLERQAPSGKILSVMSIADVPTADVVEVKHGEWISVVDRLPEEMGLYLINYVHSYSDNDGFQAMGTTLFIDGSFVGLLSVYQVTHWMHLPEPPRRMVRSDNE